MNGGRWVMALNMGTKSNAPMLHEHQVTFTGGHVPSMVT